MKKMAQFCKKAQFFKKMIFTYFMVQIFSVALASQAPQGDRKQTARDKPKKQALGFLWLATNRHLDQKHVSVLFSCDQKNLIKITLRDPGQPDHVKGQLGIIRLITNNTPPSGEGYKKFIYTASFSKKNKSLSLHKKDVPYFLQDLNTLHVQVLKNQEMGIKEYDEKVRYCERQAKKSRQKCFESSSGYQPRPPLIALWIEVDEAKRPPGRFNSLFDPKELKQLKKLPCWTS